MVKKLVMLLGVILLIIGILGFIPAVAPEGVLFGMMVVGMVQNIIYLVAGVLALLFAMQGAHEAKNFAKIFGVLFAFMAIVGFIYGNTVLELFAVGEVDNWFHAILALIFLGLGFFGHGAGHDMRHRSRDELVADESPRRERVM